MNRQIIKYILASLLFVLLTYLLDKYFIPRYIHRLTYVFHFFLFFLILVSRGMFLFLPQKNHEIFIQYWRLDSFLKLILVGVIFYLCKVRGIEDLKILAINFFVLYICYTMFDLFTLIPNLRTHLK